MVFTSGVPEQQLVRTNIHRETGKGRDLGLPPISINYVYLCLVKIYMMSKQIDDVDVYYSVPNVFSLGHAFAPKYWKKIVFVTPSCFWMTPASAP